MARGPGPPCLPRVRALCDSPAATQPHTGQESFAPPEDSEHMIAAALRDNDDPFLVWGSLSQGPGIFGSLRVLFLNLTAGLLSSSR